ncbi:hypothetical protein NMG60_11016227 [Bertholletia excelsa]
MEPANANLHHQHHHHQLEYQLVGSSSPLSSPSCYVVTTQNTILNPSNLISQNSNGIIIDSRDTRQQNDFLGPSLTSSTVQDLGLITNQPNNDLYFPRIKGEIMGTHYYQKFAEMMQSSSPSCIEDFRLKPTGYTKDNEHGDVNNYPNDQKILFRSLSSGCQIGGGLQIPATGEFYSAGTRGGFSQILPTINISKLHQSSSVDSGSLGTDMQGLNLLAGGRFAGHDNLERFPYGLDNHMQQPSHILLNGPSNISPFTSGVAVAEANKRPSSALDQKLMTHPAPKKIRPDSRASCPPFKVRKEKLGDRIAALQQLVAPFGKTDTASVLMEAIGYIKFLQSQVETLSVPYMKSSRNKTNRTMRGGSAEDGSEEAKRDLRSRGLCLVPLSCLSYVTDEGGGIWPPS